MLWAIKKIIEMGLREGARRLDKAICNKFDNILDGPHYGYIEDSHLYKVSIDNESGESGDYQVFTAAEPHQLITSRIFDFSSPGVLEFSTNITCEVLLHIKFSPRFFFGIDRLGKLPDRHPYIVKNRILPKAHVKRVGGSVYFLKLKPGANTFILK